MKAGVVVLFGCLVAAPVFAAQTHSKASAKTSKPMSDQEFVDFAAQTDMMEAHVGQMAQEQGTSQAVKDYGQMLATDHTNDYNQLTAMATKAGLTVPKGLDPQHDKMMAPLAKLKGTAFDRQFTHMMITGHEAAIAAYDRESRDGQNADVKAYATQAIPVLEKHKNAATDLMHNKQSSRAAGAATK